MAKNLARRKSDSPDVVTPFETCAATLTSTLARTEWWRVLVVGLFAYVRTWWQELHSGWPGSGLLCVYVLYCVVRSSLSLLFTSRRSFTWSDGLKVECLRSVSQRRTQHKNTLLIHTWSSNSVSSAHPVVSVHDHRHVIICMF